MIDKLEEIQESRRQIVGRIAEQLYVSRSDVLFKNSDKAYQDFLVKECFRLAEAFVKQLMNRL